MRTKRQMSRGVIADRARMRDQRDLAIGITKQSFALITGAKIPDVDGGLAEKFAEKLASLYGGEATDYTQISKDLVELIPSKNDIAKIAAPLAELDKQRRTLQSALA